MLESEIKQKLKEFFIEKGSYVEEEVVFRMRLEEKGLTFTNILRVDLLITSPSRHQIGVECKTIKDASSLGKIFGGVGQAFLYSKIFGWSYLALEVNENLAQKGREFWKRVTLTNVNEELNIGIIVVGNNVIEIERPVFVYPQAATLFLRNKVKTNICGRCNIPSEMNLLEVDGFPHRICELCKKALDWYWEPLA